MKISIHKRLIVVVLSCFLLSQIVAVASAKSKCDVESAQKMPSVTMDNFVSLWWSFEDRFYSLTTAPEDAPPRHARFTLAGNLLTLQFGNTYGATATLSQNQLKVFLGKLNNICNRAAKEKHTEYPKVLFTLIYSDENHKDQDRNWGFFQDTSKNNLIFEEYLTDLVQMKFPELLLQSSEVNRNSD